ncbi:TPA: hypothetical protein KLD23_003209, partial [Legionella pneumophila]|nr:hypothetical protein [Legionella pneumophila]HBD9283433.1 hypothetical protein [Legionella pneumophila]
SEASRHQKIKEEKEYLDNIVSKAKDNFSNIEQLATNMKNAHQSFSIETSPHYEWFVQFDKKIKQIKNNVYDDILKSIRKFDTEIQAIFNEDKNWPNIDQEIKNSEQRFLKACEEKGLSPEDVGRVKDIYNLKTEKEKEIDKLNQEIYELTNISNNLQESFDQMHQVWREQYNNRNKAANFANELAVLNDNNKPFLKVTVKYQCNYEHFVELWDSFAPKDRRKRLGKNWEELGNELFESFKSNNDYHSPWQMLNDFLNSTLEPPQNIIDNLNELKDHLFENDEDWGNLQCSRVNDSVDMAL